MAIMFDFLFLFNGKNPSKLSNEGYLKQDVRFFDLVSRSSFSIHLRLVNARCNSHAIGNFNLLQCCSSPVERHGGHLSFCVAQVIEAKKLNEGDRRRVEFNVHAEALETFFAAISIFRASMEREVSPI